MEIGFHIVLLFTICCLATHPSDGRPLTTDDHLPEAHFKTTTVKSGSDEPMGGFVEGVTHDVDWNAVGQRELNEVLTNQLHQGVAKNLIMFVGDGMGGATVSAARTYHAQSRRLQGYDAMLTFEHFPHTGVSKTYNTDYQVPDSAGTATALLCGEKVRYWTIGVSSKVEKGNCPQVKGNKLKSMLKHAQDAGKWTGIVTTTRITHATPAAAYASVPDRMWESDADVPRKYRSTCRDIAHQLIYDEYNKNIRVILGGGRKKFLPDTASDPEYPSVKGSRKDGLNLIKEWRKDKLSRHIPRPKVRIVRNRKEFEAVDDSSVEYLMGLFEPSNMKYEADRILTPASRWDEPSLEEMVAKAIRILSRNPKGFFLLVEGGRIDHAHHDNRAFLALNETVALSDAIGVATSMTDVTDTLLVTTADHSHAFMYNGYPAIQDDVTGLVSDVDGSHDDYLNSSLDLMDDKKPYLSLMYANGPGYNSHRKTAGLDSARIDLSKNDKLGSPHFVYDSAMPRKKATHGGEDVIIYSRGPMSQLFVGVHEQNYIAHAMMYAACIGSNKQHCNGVT